jgi:cytoskeletal protein CcmA (bactofilin family)
MILDKVVKKGVNMAKTGDAPNCTIGEGSVFEGKFYVNGSILIEGKFQGDIKTDDQLIVGPTGKVKTDIIARKVTIAGTLIGNILASEEVNLIETGKVLGDISTPKLIVEDGVITHGKVTITSKTDSSDIKKIISESFGNETAEMLSKIKVNKKTVKEPEEQEKKE